MSSSDRADGQTGTPRDVFSMPRDYSFSCMPESGKEKRRERDAFTRRLSSTVSLDVGTAGALPPKRRLGGSSGSGEFAYSGRPGGGVSCNGWHDDVISRSKSFTESGNSTGRVAPASPRLEFGGADGSPSPKDIDGYRFSKPGSPFFTQTRISSLAQVSHHGYSGKGILAREHSRCSEWDYPYKVDMDYRDKIWGKSELQRKTGSSYEPATPSSMHKDNEGRREQEGYGGSGDSIGLSNYHIRSYQEWRQVDRVASSALPLRSHVSSNGYLKESGGRVQGFSDVLGSWHSPLSSPVNQTADGGRDDGSQSSPRKKPRLGWGQGLAKYEKKIIGGAEDSLGTKGRGTSCSEEISSRMESPHQGTGNAQTVSLANPVSDSGVIPRPEVDKDIPTVQMEPKIEASGIDNITENNKEFGSMPASLIVRLESCQSLDAPLKSKEDESTETLLQVQPQLMVPSQFFSEDVSGSSKANILQRLEKLELELELTEKELAKLEVRPLDHLLPENDPNIDDSRNSEAVEVQLSVHTIDQKDGAGEVCQTYERGQPENEVIDDHRERQFSGICGTSLCEVTDTSKVDSKLLVSSEAQCPSLDSLHTTSVINKGDYGLDEANGCNSQGSNFKERSLSASSFSELERRTGISHCKEINSESLLNNGQTRLGSVYGTFSKTDISKCWKDLYNENIKQSQCASKALASLLPDADFEGVRVSAGKCKEMLSEEESTESMLKIKDQLQDMLLEKKLSHRFSELVLAVKYRAMRETWKREQAGLCQWTDRKEGLKKLEIERKNGTLVPTQRTSHRLRLSVSGTVKVDAVSDELHTMQKLLAEPISGYQRPHLKMPSQILDEKERIIHRFITNNALIEDPVAFEQERKTINPWTPEEKKIFLEKFFLFNKNFPKIASFIEHKTVADCIEFYYRNQKSEEFEMVRRRQQLKNRRDYSRPFSYLANTTPPSSRRREIAASCVDKIPIPSTMALYNENGRAFFSNLSKNVQSNHIASVDSNDFENPPGNSGSVSGRNIATDQSNKVKAVQSSQFPASISEEFDSQWTDHERQLFVSALGMFGKDFRNISQHVATKSEGQCKAFFSKTRKRLGLDQVLETFEMNIHENSGKAEVQTEDFNTGACVEHSKQVDIDQIPSDVKNMNGALVSECLPLDSAADIRMVTANSPEESLITECRTTGNGEEIQNIEDERSVASIPELKDCLLENRQESVPYNDIEEQTEGTEQNISVIPTETLSAPKEEKIDLPAIITDPVSGSETEAEHVNNTKLQQEVHTDEQPSNLLPSESGEENKTRVPASTVDMFERPVVEETDVQADSVNEVIEECPDVIQTSHSSSNQTSIEPVVSNVSTATCTAQPRARGNSNGGESKPRREATSWTQDEKEKFVEIIRKHGRDWGLLQENLPAKSLTQIKTYFQNSKAKLGFMAAEGTQSRITANRKHKMDDSDSINVYRLAHHKAASLSEESGLKSDQTVNGGVSTMLGQPGSDGLAFTLFGRGGTWQAEDPTGFTGKMCPNSYTQQPVTSNGLFPGLQPAALSAIIGSGFHQPQNLSMQQSLSLSTSSKSLTVNSQQTQQISGLPQLQTSSALCDFQSPLINPIKQQQKTSQVSPHSQQDYQNQSIQQLQKWIMQQQAVQSFQNIPTSVLQQQQSPQPQVILQQQNQQQHLSQSSHHVQHAITQNLHYLQQKQSIPSLGQLAAVANQQLSSKHQKVKSQYQASSQQQLMNQFQSLYGDQQKQYHSQQVNQVSQQEQHSILRSLQDQLALKLHHHQQQLQSEKQPLPLWINLPIQMHENAEISHHHQGQAPDILFEKEHKELHNCQTALLHKGVNRANHNDSSNLHDSIELKNVLKPQSHETGHSQESQVNVHVCAHPQLKPGAVSESLQAKAGDVKLFGQFLLSQPTSSLNSTSSATESGFSKPMFSVSSTSVSPVAASISEGLPYAYPDGTPCLPSGFGRIGLSFSQGQCHNFPRQSTSAGNTGLRNNLLEGREHVCQGAESENDVQNNQAVISRVTQRLAREGKECESIRFECASPFLKFEVGEQSKRLQDGQNQVMELGIKRQADQSISVALTTGDHMAAISDLKSCIPCMSNTSGHSSMKGKCQDIDLSSAIEAIMESQVSSSQAITVVDAILAFARRQGSHELRYLGGNSSEELHQSKDLPGNGVCHAVNASQSVITNTQSPALAQSFAGGVGTSQVNKDNSFWGQSILHGTGNVGVDVSMWSSGTSDLHRVTVPTVSSVWPPGSVIVEGQPRPKDSKDAEDNKRQSA